MEESAIPTVELGQMIKVQDKYFVLVEYKQEHNHPDRLVFKTPEELLEKGFSLW